MRSVDDHTSDTGQAAMQQMQGVCSDQMLKRQLQSLKASFINLGQKESFAEGERKQKAFDHEFVDQTWSHTLTCTYNTCK